MKESTKYIIKHKVWIENEEGKGLLGDGKWELLKLIHEKGSLKMAIEEKGWAYRSTWNKLKTLEEKLEFSIVEKNRGGAGGGGQTVLTEKGKALVECFNKLNFEVDKKLKGVFEIFSDELQRISK